MKKMKICLVLPCFLPVPAIKGGGREMLAYNVVKCNEIYNMLDLTIVSIYDFQAVSESKNWKATNWIFIKKTIIDTFSDYLFRVLRRILKRSLKVSTYDYKVLKRLKGQKFDRIIFEGGNAVFLTEYQKFFKKEKLMFHLHNVERPDYDIGACCNKVITISEYVRRILLDNSKLKPKNVYTLFNGIETEKFSKTPSKKMYESMKGQLGLATKDFVVLYVGRVVEGKGVEELISAVLSLEDSSIKLLLVGSAVKFHKKYMNTVKSLCNSAPDRIIQVGYVPNEQLFCYYNIADCFIMPSTCEEGAGLVQSEAYAAGKPVIVSNQGGIPEYCLKDASLVVEYDANFVRNIKEAIIKMRNMILSNKFNAEHIKVEAKKYSSEKYYLNYVELLRKELAEEK